MAQPRLVVLAIAAAASSSCTDAPVDGGGATAGSTLSKPRPLQGLLNRSIAQGTSLLTVQGEVFHFDRVDIPDTGTCSQPAPAGIGMCVVYSSKATTHVVANGQPAGGVQRWAKSQAVKLKTDDTGDRPALSCPPFPVTADGRLLPIDMSMSDVRRWLEGSAMARFVPILQEHEIDGLALSLISAQDMTVAMGLPLGVSAKLKRCVAATPLETDLEARATQSSTEVLPSMEFHRRQTQNIGSALCAADVDSSGLVETSDLLQVLSAFGTTCPDNQPGGDGDICACSGELAEMVETLRRLQDGTTDPGDPRPPQPAPPPPPRDVTHGCADSTTWVSSVDMVGCSQYGPGETSWQPMCSAHVGYDLSSSGGTQSTPIIAAEACPASCDLCPSCNDNKQNGDETGIDCGGSSCDPCALVSGCGSIESTGLVGENLEAICSGQATGDTCFTKPAPGYRPSTPGAAVQQCSSAGSECAAQLRAMLNIPAAGVTPGHFVCTATGLWEGEQLQVLPILPTTCPARIQGNHYGAECVDPQTCVAKCDAGYRTTRGDGVFICRGGTWVGDLVCEPISCGLTLDKAPVDESAFSICTDGDTLGSECTAFCREGFYSTVGTGVGYFVCMDEANGLWMQQGFSPWWESSLQCTRCPVIENCDVSSCTTGTDAQCSACAEGFYGYRHDETPTRCLPNSVTVEAAGFDADAAGIFSLVFSGTVGADFRDSRVTTSVLSTSSLSLVGTRVEPIGMSFAVTGGVLSLRDLNMVGSTLQASAVGQITVETCVGSLSDITVDDSSLEVLGATGGLEISGQVQLTSASSMQDVRIKAVTFVDASLSVESTTLRMDSCRGSFAPVPTTHPRQHPKGIQVSASTVIMVNTSAAIRITDVQVSTSVVTFDSMPGGQMSGAVDLSSSTVVMGAFDVVLTTVTVQQTNWSTSDCQGSVSTIMVAQDSHVDITGGQWLVTHMQVTTGSHVNLCNCSGSFSNVKVDGRADSGYMGSCDGTTTVPGASPGMVCASYDDITPPFWRYSRAATEGCLASSSPANCCTQWVRSCDGPHGSCCSTSGNVQLCRGAGQTARCDSIALGSSLNLDIATSTNATFSCTDRYRGDVCDIVPKTCRSYYDSSRFGVVHETRGFLGDELARQEGCSWCPQTAVGQFQKDTLGRTMGWPGRYTIGGCLGGVGPQFTQPYWDGRGAHARDITWVETGSLDPVGHYIFLDQAVCKSADNSC